MIKWDKIWNMKINNLLRYYNLKMFLVNPAIQKIKPKTNIRSMRWDISIEFIRIWDHVWNYHTCLKVGIIELEKKSYINNMR